MIRFRARATDDVRIILEHYRSTYPGRAERFLAAMDRALEVVDTEPLAFAVFEPPDIRGVQLRSFPYRIVYIAIRGDAEVIAIVHGRRRPSSFR